MTKRILRKTTDIMAEREEKMRNPWMCRRCGKHHPIPSLARECEEKDAQQLGIVV